MARIAQPPIPLKVYRHFAVITVVLTALIALFASDENRGAVTKHIEQQEREAELQRISTQRSSKPEIARRDTSRQYRFDGGDRHDFGLPMVRVSGDSLRTMGNFPANGGTRSGENVAVPGYSQAFLDSLTEEEYLRLLESLRAAGMLSPAERAKTLAKLEAGSRQRSGAASPSDGMGLVQ